MVARGGGVALALEPRVDRWEAAWGRCALGLLVAPSSLEGSPREGSSPHTHLLG